jgi:hypothetical protein
MVRIIENVLPFSAALMAFCKCGIAIAAIVPITTQTNNSSMIEKPFSPLFLIFTPHDSPRTGQSDIFWHLFLDKMRQFLPQNYQINRISHMFTRPWAF